MKTTPREIILDGYRFCIKEKQTIFGTQACNLIREIGATNIHEDGEDLIFAFFRYVSTNLLNSIKCVKKIYYAFQKNLYADGRYEVYTGESTHELINIFNGKNGSPYLSIWGEGDDAALCNEVRGTDATYFPPLLEKNSMLSIYTNDICASVDVHYDGTMEYKTREGYRFTPRDDFLINVGPEYGNGCFCVNNTGHGDFLQASGCLYSGALDLTKCVSE